MSCYFDIKISNAHFLDLRNELLMYNKRFIGNNIDMTNKQIFIRNVIFLNKVKEFNDVRNIDTLLRLV